MGILPESPLERKIEEKLAFQQELAAMRKAYTADIFRLMAANELAAEKFRADEARLLKEIERQRQLNNKLQQELDARHAPSMQRRYT